MLVDSANPFAFANICFQVLGLNPRTQVASPRLPHRSVRPTQTISLSRWTSVARVRPGAEATAGAWGMEHGERRRALLICLVLEAIL